MPSAISDSEVSRRLSVAQAAGKMPGVSLAEVLADKMLKVKLNKTYDYQMAKDDKAAERKKAQDEGKFKCIMVGEPVKDQNSFSGKTHHCTGYNAATKGLWLQHYKAHFGSNKLKDAAIIQLAEEQFKKTFPDE